MLRKNLWNSLMVEYCAVDRCAFGVLNLCYQSVRFVGIFIFKIRKSSLGKAKLSERIWWFQAVKNDKLNWFLLTFDFALRASFHCFLLFPMQFPKFNLFVCLKYNWNSSGILTLIHSKNLDKQPGNGQDDKISGKQDEKFVHKKGNWTEKKRNNRFTASFTVRWWIWAQIINGNINIIHVLSKFGVGKMNNLIIH